MLNDFDRFGARKGLSAHSVSIEREPASSSMMTFIRFFQAEDLEHRRVTLTPNLETDSAERLISGGNYTVDF